MDISPFKALSDSQAGRNIGPLKALSSDKANYESGSPEPVSRQSYPNLEWWILAGVGIFLFFAQFGGN